eukprot:8752399-Prorocentrum_lima.AAC.1
MWPGRGSRLKVWSCCVTGKLYHTWEDDNNKEDNKLQKLDWFLGFTYRAKYIYILALIMAGK